MKNARNRIISFIIIFITIFVNTSITFAYPNNDKTANIHKSDIEDNVNEFMNQQIGRTAPGAAVVIVKDGEVLLSKGYGYADLENKTPVEPDATVFEYGSISKLFTWVSVMQLVEEGKIKLDADIKSYLPPEFVSKLNYNYPITMYDLMSHTAGFEQQPFDWLPFSPDGIFAALEDYLAKHQPQQVYVPGEVMAYSNYGVALAGLAVEYISGEKFYDYEMNHIFIPLDMNMASGNPTLSDKPELYKTKAKGYIPIGDSGFKQGIWMYFPEYPAGSVNGTITDLSRFLLALTPEETQNSALFQNRLSYDDMLAQSYTPIEGMPSNAHGFWEYESNERYLYHPGDTASYSSFIAFSPEKRFGFAILANAAQANELIYGLSEILLGSERDSDIQSILEPFPNANELSGDYLLAMSCYNSVFEAICQFTNKVKVKALGENEISVRIAGQVSEYVQIRPYYYELKKASNPVTSFMDQHLFFEMHNGKVKRISSGNMDIVPLSSERTVLFFWLSIILFAVLLLFFIISPIVFLVIWIRLKTKTAECSEGFLKQFYLVYSLTLSGTILVLNNAYVMFLAITDIFHDWQNFRTHIIINWIILFELIILVAYSLYKTHFYKLNQKLKKFTYFNLILIAIALFLFLNWHFFNLAI